MYDEAAKLYDYIL